MVSKQELDRLRCQTFTDMYTALLARLDNVNEMVLRADPASYTPEVLPVLWVSVTRELSNNQPSLSLARAGELAAARLRNHMSGLVRLYESGDHELNASETVMYEAFYGANNPWDVLVNVSGNRTMLYDMDEPEAQRPMDAELLPNVAQQQAQQRAELDAQLARMQVEREQRLADNQAKQRAYAQERAAEKARLEQEELDRQAARKWYQENGVYFGGRASTNAEFKAREESLERSKTYAVEQALEKGLPVPAVVLADRARAKCAA